MFYLSIASGAATGALLRYAVMLLSAAFLGVHFPYATLFVNAIGSFCVGLIVARADLSEAWLAFLQIGLLGSFTTFSSFSLDTLRLMKDGAWLLPSLNVFLNVFLCLSCCYLAMTFFKTA